jgi:hypothetical protein
MNEQLEMIKAVYEDSEAEINGRKYTICKLNHQKRLRVFAYFTEVQSDMERNSMGFMGTPQWADIWKVICENTMYDGDLLIRRKNHFDEYPEDFVIFAVTMMGVFSYPFLRGSLIA